MPVILRPYAAQSNGFVTAGPRRMELFTIQDPGSSLVPVPWEKLLSIHEGRHVAQNQFARTSVYRWIYYLFGDLNLLYINLSNGSIMEGDAVVAETALTPSGRGRSADFLSYMKMSFDNGDMRSWMKWRHGSIKKYTPDHYRVGYMTVAGMRYVYDAPSFMTDYLNTVANPFRFAGVAAVAKKYSGKRFEATWRDIALTFKTIWTEEDSLRAPFTDFGQITQARKRFTVYKYALAGDGCIYAVRAAMDSPSDLVRISSDGTVRKLCSFSGEGKLAWSLPLRRIYWCEVIPDIRWEHTQVSRIRYYDFNGTRTLTRKGRYFNPSVSPDGLTLAVSEYCLDGSTAVVLMDAGTGKTEDRFKMPSGMTLKEPVIADGKVFLSAVSEEGSGLYEIALEGKKFRGGLQTVLKPSPVSLKDLRLSEDGSLLFVSDLDGSSEAYRCDGGGLTRLTTTKYGLESPFMFGGKLHASLLRPSGKMIAALDEENVPADFSKVHHYPVADKLAAQEKFLAARHNAPDGKRSPAMEARPYRRAGHLLKLHSWAPAYYNYDRFSASYAGKFYETVSPGAMAFFQNELGTFAGAVGLSLHRKYLREDKFMPGLHLRMTYRGLFPVFDAGLDLGDRSSWEYTCLYHTDKDSTSLSYSVRPHPYLAGYGAVSFPFNFSSGGWTRALEATMKIQSSNDLLVDPAKPVKTDSEGNLVPDSGHAPSFYLKSNPLEASVALRGVFTRDVAPSQMRPSLGGGFDIGYRTILNGLVPSYYGKGYFYLPGFSRTQSFKIGIGARYNPRGAVSEWFTDPCPLLPRGLDKEVLLNQYTAFASPFMASATIDYAIAFLPVDFSIARLLYLRNFELMPFADLAVADFAASGNSFQTLYCAGADLTAKFLRIIIPLNLSVGVRAGWCGGSAMPYISGALEKQSRFRISFVTSTKF